MRSTSHQSCSASSLKCATPALLIRIFTPKSRAAVTVLAISPAWGQIRLQHLVIAASRADRFATVRRDRGCEQQGGAGFGQFAGKRVKAKIDGAGEKDAGGLQLHVATSTGRAWKMSP